MYKISATIIWKNMYGVVENVKLHFYRNLKFLVLFTLYHIAAIFVQALWRLTRNGLTWKTLSRLTYIQFQNGTVWSYFGRPKMQSSLLIRTRSNNFIGGVNINESDAIDVLLMKIHSEVPRILKTVQEKLHFLCSAYCLHHLYLTKNIIQLSCIDLCRKVYFNTSQSSALMTASYKTLLIYCSVAKVFHYSIATKQNLF